MVNPAQPQIYYPGDNAPLRKDSDSLEIKAGFPSESLSPSLHYSFERNDPDGYPLEYQWKDRKDGRIFQLGSSEIIRVFDDVKRRGSRTVYFRVNVSVNREQLTSEPLRVSLIETSSTPGTGNVVNPNFSEPWSLKRVRDFLSNLWDTFNYLQKILVLLATIGVPVVVGVVHILSPKNYEGRDDRGNEVIVVDFERAYSDGCLKGSAGTLPGMKYSGSFNRRPVEGIVTFTCIRTIEHDAEGTFSDTFGNQCPDNGDGKDNGNVVLYLSKEKKMIWDYRKCSKVNDKISLRPFEKNR
jgi:hypothetical protein